MHHNRLRFSAFLLLLVSFLPGNTLLYAAPGTRALNALQDSSIITSSDSIRAALMEQYYVPIDSIKDKVVAFKAFDRGRFGVNRVELDTMLTGFHIKNVAQENYRVGSYLGNVGLSYYSPLFHLREQPGDFMFTDHIKLYMHTPQNMLHYQARTPYSIITYSSAGEKIKNEMTLHVVHTQNVNKDLNLGIVFDANTSKGQYYNQGTGDNAFSLFGSYRGTNYSLFSTMNINNIKMMENGGLADLNDFYLRTHQTESYTMRSNSGRTILKDRSFSVTQSYSFNKFPARQRGNAPDAVWSILMPVDSLLVMLPDSLQEMQPDSSLMAVPLKEDEVSRFTLVHNLEYEVFDRYYSDANAGPHSLYPHAYINRLATSDTAYARRLSNSFELMFRERDRARFTAGFAVGVLNQMDKYSFGIIPDTAYSGSTRVITRRDGGTSANTALTGRFFNHTGRKVNWDVGARLFFTGDKTGAFDVDGAIKYHYYTPRGRNTLTLGGTIVNEQPGYFLKQYGSNSYVWRNHFNQSQQLRLRAEFDNSARRFQAGVYVAQLNNWMYFDASALPAQSSQALLSATVMLKKHVVAGHFNFLFELYGQYSSDQTELPLPSFSGYQSSFYQSWLKKNVLNMQLGYDVRFFTQYYAYDYAPSTGVFFLQNKAKVGNYPFVDVFLNLKLKRVRLSVLGENLSTLLGSLGKKYFTTYGYPMPEARLKFGLSWSFYD